MCLQAPGGLTSADQLYEAHMLKDKGSELEFLDFHGFASITEAACPEGDARGQRLWSVGLWSAKRSALYLPTVRSCEECVLGPSLHQSAVPSSLCWGFRDFTSATDSGLEVAPDLLSTGGSGGLRQSFPCLCSVCRPRCLPVPRPVPLSPVLTSRGEVLLPEVEGQLNVMSKIAQG